ncbi:hypothetical protein NPIL_647221 [Nephila pilipes]|uniref:Uncharacterized protein n=1 Tax=Nephila pilipes TaxID=299642 RepID=A0A8X6PLG4_NEPPI|nr:hypothetical protein NPIL_647221 [Nephila pilipes]
MDTTADPGNLAILQRNYFCSGITLNSAGFTELFCSEWLSGGTTVSDFYFCSGTTSTKRFTSPLLRGNYFCSRETTSAAETTILLQATGRYLRRYSAAETTSAADSTSSEACGRLLLQPEFTLQAELLPLSPFSFLSILFPLDLQGI